MQRMTCKVDNAYLKKMYFACLIALGSYILNTEFKLFPSFLFYLMSYFSI